MKKIYLLGLFLFFSNFTYSQICGFDIQRDQLRKNPNYIELEKAAEQKIKDVIKNRNYAYRSSTTVLTIPVVVHVLHLAGEAVGDGTNISDAQIQSSIDNLNNFYSGSLSGSSLNFQIEFILAKRAPNCTATTGINRIDASAVPNYTDNGVKVGVDGTGADENTLKDLSRWPETDYLNIWIVSEINGNNGEAGIQGYASFFAGNAYEGSVMMHTVFGYDPNDTSGWNLPITKDNSTVVHEIGHYFHLYHTFQGDNSGTECPADQTVGADSDGCADTVPHKRETSTCPAQNSCSNSAWVDDNTKNNMMSYYSCQDRMTADQKTRVRAAMEGTSIVTSKGGLVPDANFGAPVGSCATNDPQNTDNSGIVSVALNGVTFTSGSSNADSGNIDKSANCVSYFEIDTAESNTLSVGMFSANTQQLGIWIDWNDDGDFDDNAEQQYLSDDIAQDATITHTLTYPANIPYNDYVRIRLVTDLDGYSNAPSTLSACSQDLFFGQSEDYAIFVKPNSSATWTGTGSTEFATAGNWDTNVIPVSATNVIIPSAPTNQPVIAANGRISMNNLTIATGASLEIASGGSLIVAGTATGDITYNLGVPDTNWYLASSPVDGEEYNNIWLGANDVDASNSGKQGISTYSNSTPHASTEHWRYYGGGGNFEFYGGIGYGLKRKTPGNFKFTGAFPTTDVVSNISQNDNNWNLLGNPYPSNIDISAFITTNTAKISGAFQAIYIWNGTAYASLSAGYLRVGQGFFVNSKLSSGTIQILETMQSHNTVLTQTKDANASITLKLSDNTSSKETKINYLEGKTKGLDPAFDIGLFDGASSNLKLYTRLVEDYEEIAFETQALPNADFDTMVIPLGVKAAAGKEINFSAEALNLPADVKVFLEDKQTNTFVRLDEVNSEYTVTLSESLNGIGRFYVHTSSAVLSISNEELLAISMHSLNKKIYFSGLPLGKTKVKVFDVLGKIVLEKSITETTKFISADNLNSGNVYIVRLSSEKGKMNKKIIVNK